MTQHIIAFNTCTLNWLIRTHMLNNASIADIEADGTVDLCMAYHAYPLKVLIKGAIILNT